MESFLGPIEVDENSLFVKGRRIEILFKLRRFRDEDRRNAFAGEPCDWVFDVRHAVLFLNLANEGASLKRIKLADRAFELHEERVRLILMPDSSFVLRGNCATSRAALELSLLRSILCSRFK